MSEVVTAMADQLRQYAGHFEVRDWNYTRDLKGMKFIRFADDFTGYDHPMQRLKRSVKELFGPRDSLHEMSG